MEAYQFNAREGQSTTFCWNARQIYRKLFVSNSRNQHILINPSQITACAAKIVIVSQLKYLYELRKNYALPYKVT